MKRKYSTTITIKIAITISVTIIMEITIKIITIQKFRQLGDVDRKHAVKVPRAGARRAGAGSFAGLETWVPVWGCSRVFHGSGIWVGVCAVEIS